MRLMEETVPQKGLLLVVVDENASNLHPKVKVFPVMCCHTQNHTQIW
jgi:hypothetical protein